jgi:hypothetical protein
LSAEEKTHFAANATFRRYQSLCALAEIEASALRSLGQQKPDTVYMTIPLPNDSAVRVCLMRRNPFSLDAQPTMTDASGNGKRIDQSLLPTMYAGKVVGDDESIVSLCCTSDEIFGLLTLRGATYNIGKMQNNTNNSTSGAAEVYAVSDDRADAPQREQMPQCAVTEQEIMQHSTEILSTLRELANTKGGATLQSDRRLRVEVALEVDFATYQQFNNSVERASAYATSLIATVSQIFERDLNVELSISYLNVWTTQDPFTGNSTSTVLNRFKSYWRSNRVNIRRTVAHLLSSRSLGGGRAGLNTFCDKDDGYGVSGSLRNLSSIVSLPTYSYEVKILAHELGHNFGSPHTHSCLWPGGAIDSCAQAEEGNCFTNSRPRIGTIMSYCDSRGGSVEMRLHPLCSRLMRGMAEKAACVGNENLPTIYTLSGTIRLEDGLPAANIEFTLYSDNVGETRTLLRTFRTNAQGQYTVDRLATGQYKIQPPSSFVFLPMSEESPASLIIAGSNVLHDITIARAYVVSIRNTNSSSHWIQIMGNRIGRTISQAIYDGSGSVNLPNGNYSIIPTTSNGVIFTPPIQRVTVNGANVVIPAFVATSAPQRFAITGKVKDSNNNGLEGITITVKGATSQFTTRSDANGAYIVNNLPIGRYEVRAAIDQYDFSPSYWTYDIDDTDGWNGDFQAAPTVSVQTAPSQLTFPPLQSGLDAFLPIQFTNPANASGAIRVEVTVQPTNGTPRHVISVNGTAASFTLQPGQTNTLQVRFAPNAAAQFTANIIVTDRTTGRQLAVIPVSGTGLLNILPLGTPVLIAPANGSTATNRSLTFAWQAVPNATSYRFTIATARSTATNVPNLWSLDTIVSGTTLFLTLPDRTPFYWRVQARNATMQGTFSDEFTLNIRRDTVPTMPTLITITNVNLQSAQGAWQLDRITPRDSGFVHGTNLYLHRAKATALRLPAGQTQGQISQIAVWFAYKRPGLTNQTYRIELYSGTAQSGPQRLLAAQDYILAGVASGNIDMVNITLPVIPTLHTFSPPVSVGESFFVGVNFGQYGVAAISDAAIAAGNLVGRRVAEDWEMAVDGRWVNMSDAWFPPTSPNGWNMWIAAGLLPTATSVSTAQDNTNYRLTNFPNPCSDATSIQYTLTTPAEVQLEILSLLGTQVMSLVQERQSAGNYVVPVDVRHLPSGQYYYRLRVGAEQIVRTLQVVR